MENAKKVKSLFPEFADLIDGYIEEQRNNGYRGEFEDNGDAIAWAIKDDQDQNQYICLYEYKSEGFLMITSDICKYTGRELEQIIWENLKLALPFRSSIDEDEQVVTVYWTKIHSINLKYLNWVLHNHLSYSNILRKYLIEKYSI